MSDARRTIDAYIRDLRAGFEGSKGASHGSGKLFTGKRALNQRWQMFRNDRAKAKLPMVGTLRLFTECWKAQRDLVELTATGHSKCDECVKIQVSLLSTPPPSPPLSLTRTHNN